MIWYFVKWEIIGKAINLVNWGRALWDTLHQTIFVRSDMCVPSSFVKRLNDKSRYSTSLSPLNWPLCREARELLWRSRRFNFLQDASVSMGNSWRGPLIIDNRSNCPDMLVALTESLFNFVIWCPSIFNTERLPRFWKVIDTISLPYYINENEDCKYITY